MSGVVETFEDIYRKEYEQELESCDRWIMWCTERQDTHGMNFYQGMQCALIYNDIKMRQLLRMLKTEDSVTTTVEPK